MANINSPDLTKCPPRSARVRLGGYVTLPRMLDKGRATIAGKNGDYHYDCPMDQRFLEFAGVNAAALKKQLATGKGDGEILAWIQKNSKNKPTDSAIAAWSAWMEQRAPGSLDGREYVQSEQKRCAPAREDIATWFDYLDVDDFVTFGGKLEFAGNGARAGARQTQA